MKTIFNKKYGLVLLVIIILAATAFFFGNKNTVTYTNARVKKAEETMSMKLDVSKSSGNLLQSDDDPFEMLDNQALNDMDFLTVFYDIKDMLILFSDLIIALSFYIFFVSGMKRWILLDSNIKNFFFIVRHLHLQDGNKDAFSKQFSF